MMKSMRRGTMAAISGSEMLAGAGAAVVVEFVAVVAAIVCGCAVLVGTALPLGVLAGELDGLARAVVEEGRMLELKLRNVLDCVLLVGREATRHHSHVQSKRVRKTMAMVFLGMHTGYSPPAISGRT